MCSATSKNWAKLINCSLIYSFCPVFVVVATCVPPFNIRERGWDKCVLPFNIHNRGQDKCPGLYLFQTFISDICSVE